MLEVQILLTFYRQWWWSGWSMKMKSLGFSLYILPAPCLGSHPRLNPILQIFICPYISTKIGGSLSFRVLHSKGLIKEQFEIDCKKLGSKCVGNVFVQLTMIKSLNWAATNQPATINSKLLSLWNFNRTLTGPPPLLRTMLLEKE